MMMMDNDDELRAAVPPLPHSSFSSPPPTEKRCIGNEQQQQLVHGLTPSPDPPSVFSLHNGCRHRYTSNESRARGQRFALLGSPPCPVASFHDSSVLPSEPNSFLRACVRLLFQSSLFPLFSPAFLSFVGCMSSLSLSSKCCHFY